MNEKVSMKLLLVLIITGSLLIATSLAGCKDGPGTGREPSVEEFSLPVKYRPLIADDWAVSTPEDQNLDDELISDLYKNAAELKTLYSLLVVRNGFLIAEQYFNGGSMDDQTLLQSVSKSYISALIGIAIQEGCLSGIDQKMIEFFPEVADDLTDPRKRDISIRQMLHMRSGYPDEETDRAYLEALYWGVYPPLIEDFPLVSAPGAAFHYSNVTYSWLAILLERACGPDLKDFARQNLFEPIGTEVGKWLTDREGHYIGSGGIHATARDAAKFGLLYLHDGDWEGRQVISADWVHASLRRYSKVKRNYGRGFAFRDLGYGYGWWSASAGDHNFSFAWGHGGQLIVLLDELHMMIVTTADPFFGQHDGESWRHEKAVFNLVGRFIETL